ncbi:lipocalin family protein [uncultured Croceitalea sp.]|uniref:lipocalin family protein n=1 Tax=uncultured Croceitalea sp. TaxID=1798908 RepID=UPI00374E679B
MKKAFLASILILLFSCSDDNQVFESTEQLVGTWLLIEQYADPGDGSGEYKPVNSDRIVTFNANGTYSSNGSFCNLFIDSNEDVSGNYEINLNDLSKYSSENFLIPEGCSFEDGRVFIHFEGNNLILSYLCIEGCGQKYRKIN